MRDVDNSQDVLDSRDVITRLDELTTEREALIDEIAEAKTEADKWAEYPANDSGRIEAEHALETCRASLAEWIEDNQAELDSLSSFADEGANCSGDWTHGETLIRGTYWVEYVQDLLQDIGDLPKDIPHYIAIDWDKTADNIAADYSTIDFDGVEYYIRSC